MCTEIRSIDGLHNGLVDLEQITAGSLKVRVIWAEH